MKNKFWRHVLRILFFELMLVIIGFVNGLFTNPDSRLISVFLLLLSLFFSLKVLSNYYGTIPLSLTNSKNEKFTLKYLKYGFPKEIKFNNLVVETKIGLSNNSRITTKPLKVLLSNGKFHFFLNLIDAIPFFNFVQEKGGLIKKDFDFITALKELKSNSEYQEVVSEIEKLIS